MVFFNTDKYCSDTFWNSSVSWDTDNPKFSTCFKNSLFLIPSGILWLTSVPWIIWILKWPFNKAPKATTKVFSGLFWSKLMLTVVLFGAIAAQLSFVYIEGSAMAWSDVAFFVVATTTTMLTFGLLIFEKVNQVRSSLPMTIYWPLLFLATLPSLLDSLQNLDSNSQSFNSQIASMALALPIILGLCVLNLFADLSGLDLKDQEVAPLHLASHFSFLFFGWFENLVFKGYKKPLTQKDLPHVPDFLKVRGNVDTFMQNWDYHIKANAVDFSAKTGKKKVLTLWKPLIKSFGLRFGVGNFLGLIHYTAVFSSPMILKLLIDHVDNQEEEAWKGYLYATVLLFASVFNTMIFSHYVFTLVEVAIQIRSSLIAAIFRKSLRLSNASRQKFTTGEITNYVSVDTQRLLDSISYLGILWGSPYQVILSMAFLYQELGLAALAGCLGLALLMPQNIIGGKIVEKLQEKQLTAKDSRIKLMNEVLQGMKVLKLYAWELPFIKRIDEIRTKEIKYIKANAKLWTILNFTFSMSPFVITIASFSTFVFMDPKLNLLTPQKVFVSISLFNLLRIPLTLFPMVIKETARMLVSIRRITKFLNAEELSSESIQDTPDENSKVAVEVSKASFTWEDTATPILKDVNVQVPKGSLTAIVGVVGSGKSSLMQAMLGEMECVQGETRISGKLAYVSQQAWIQNMSLKDNILFSKPFENKRYQEVIDACALREDLKLLSNVDETEIGENGINLSGGQKQRVSLARAVYSNGDIYLLDDPLSAVDAHVGKHIFERVISSRSGLLKDKTRIWITNQVSHLQNTDQILVMKEGQVCEAGDYGTLMITKGILYDFVQQHLVADKEDEAIEDHETVAHENTEGKTGGQLIEDETSLTGHVPLHIFKDFIMKIGLWHFLFSLFGFALEQGLHAGGIVWLSSWSDTTRIDNSTANDEAAFRLGVYGAFSISEAIIQLARDLVFYLQCANAAQMIHHTLLNSIMKSPMSFFDTNPTGRIINRFSTDVDTMDGMIPFQMGDLLWCFMDVVTTLTMICYATPTFLIVILPIIIVFVIVQRFYIVTSRQLKRLYSISKSPIFSHFSETVSGAPTIRAYRQIKRFVHESEAKVEINVISHYLSMASNRWLSTRIENIGNLIIFFTALFAVINRESLSPGLAALSITYALNVTMSVVWVVRMGCELENNCVALERIFEYTQNTPEAEWDILQDDQDSWPSQGLVEFNNYQTRYREGLDLVLKGVDLKINPKDKVGICGRTGAGKSSLTLALFRIIESTSGNIIIDGQDISHLGLHNLRSKLTIIPQDPVLFTGSLRFNIDPVGEHTDQELWHILELAHLKSHIVKNRTEGLDHEVSEGGSNFSVGQRQLICLARALLRKTKILILDEATAAVDPETDELIQATIRSEFKDCTVLTIAHRLNTILDSDTIVVLGQGQVLEMDSPDNLLKQQDSHFRAMAQDAGIIIKQ